jgi:microcin C transport system permease protein
LTHAFRNSVIPVATTFGQNIGLILTGSFLIEVIFDIDGFGLLGFNSIVQRDYPMVMGILLISSILLLVGNILSDLLVAMIDPRIRFR